MHKELPDIKSVQFFDFLYRKRYNLCNGKLQKTQLKC